MFLTMPNLPKILQNQLGKDPLLRVKHRTNHKFLKYPSKIRFNQSLTRRYNFLKRVLFKHKQLRIKKLHLYWLTKHLRNNQSSSQAIRMFLCQMQQKILVMSQCLLKLFLSNYSNQQSQEMLQCLLNLFKSNSFSKLSQRISLNLTK